MRRQYPPLVAESLLEEEREPVRPRPDARRSGRARGGGPIAPPAGAEPEIESLLDGDPDPARRAPGAGGILVAAIALVLGAALVGLSVFALHHADPQQGPGAAAPAPYAAASQAAPPAEAVEHDAEAITALPDPGWARETASRTGIPERGLLAYAGAALQLAREQPGCGLGWNTLAGIGWVESHHGTIDGGVVDQDGYARPGIVGVPLDGDGVAHIPDSDGGEFDGDPVHDRAVGPMQFIPATWALYGADGNGDGMRDPQQIDDAALAAARYLCEVGQDLSVEQNWLAAIGAYNAPVEYAIEVSTAATHYADLAG
ncbi:lytic transglycosylase domain-containing protein [Gulosibacter sp. 10]|uniref:lytic transglycosylase domain-containing protein n=1 Tax=Gulosibacter sp. 10 TaxID=1255570 RepID=UPI00097E9489|nr:lytic murein transglycosylase [Gulosibacter sp. 10]SJM68143.1 putative secreted protein [Gulosibacter sp. 10]